MDLEEVMEVGGDALLDRWLGMALVAALPEGEDDSGEEATFKLKAAQAAVKAIAGPEAPLEERMQALLYVVAHSAAIEQQARASARLLPEPARACAQRFASRLMALTAQQLSTLQRLRAVRAKAEAAAGRAAKKEVLLAHKASTDRDLALVRMLEQQIKEITGPGAEGALKLDGDEDEDVQDPAPPEPPETPPEPPETPPEPPETPPVTAPNRRMRRAAARQARREAQETARAAAE